ncbi:MAG TPA: glycosyltransferase, partial [Opitutaceae bacterium]
LLRVIASVDPATGGPVAGLRAITPELTKLGHETEFLTVDDPAADFLKNPIARVHACGPAVNSYAHSPRVRLWLREHSGNYDAIIVHGLWQDLGRAVRKVCTERHQPYFVFPHGMLDPTLHKTYRFRHFKKWVYWLLVEGRVLREARAVFFTCEEERRLARESFPLYSVSECVVKYGASTPPSDVAAIATQSAEVRRTPKSYWLFLGRIHSKKGIELLLGAYGRLLANLSFEERSSLPRLVIAGPCHDLRYLEQLKNQAVANGIAERVEWPGMLSGDAKWRALANAETFVLPSYQENFGIAVAESLAAGTPVLLSERVNIWKEIVGDGAGLVAPPTEAGTLDLLQRWRRLSSEDRESMRSAAKRCFQSRFEISAVAVDFADKLSTLIRRPVSAA